MDNVEKEAYCDFVHYIISNMRDSREIIKDIKKQIQKDYHPTIIEDNLTFLIKYLYKLPPSYFNACYYKGFLMVSYLDENKNQSYGVKFLDFLENKHLKYLDETVKKSRDDSELILNLYSQTFRLKIGISSIRNNLYYDVLIDRFFRDYSENFKLYIKSLKTFDKNFESKISKSLKAKLNILFSIDDELKQINGLELGQQYQKFLKLYNKMLESKINYKDLLYDCYQKAKTIFAKEYAKSLSKLSDFPFKYIKGVKVYYRNNKNFKAFISCLTNKRTDNIQFPKLKYRRRYSDIISTSYVSNDSLITFKDLKRTLTLGYFNIYPSMLVHGMSRDSFSLSVLLADNLPVAISSHIIEFLTPEDMLKKCSEQKTYSEFCFIYPDNPCAYEEDYKYISQNAKNLVKNSVLKPSCVFCLNEPTEAELKFAKKNNLPIFVSEVENYRYYWETSKDLNDNFVTNY